MYACIRKPIPGKEDEAKELIIREKIILAELDYCICKGTDGSKLSAMRVSSDLRERFGHIFRYYVRNINENKKAPTQ